MVNEEYHSLGSATILVRLLTSYSCNKADLNTTGNFNTANGVEALDLPPEI
jgi:hypothetical protein